MQKVDFNKLKREKDSILALDKNRIRSVACLNINSAELNRAFDYVKAFKTEDRRFLAT